MAADPVDTLVTEKVFREHPLESTRRTFLKQAAGLSAACMVGFDGQSGAEANGRVGGSVTRLEQPRTDLLQIGRAHV